MKQNADTERERHEGALAALKEQADKISLGIKAAETKCHRAESGVGGTCTRPCRGNER